MGRFFVRRLQYNNWGFRLMCNVIKSHTRIHHRRSETFFPAFNCELSGNSTKVNGDAKNVH